MYRIANDPKTPPHHAAACARSWDVLEERKRILRMKPKPRDVEVPMNSGRPRRRVMPQVVTEPDHDYEQPSATPTPPTTAA